MNGQLEMNLAAGGENLFRRNLENGTFFIMAEHEPPGSGIAPEAAGEKLATMDAVVDRLSDGDPAMLLAVTDRYGFASSHRACEYAGALPPQRRNRHLYYLSGRDTGFEQFCELAGVCRSLGVTNVVPVTGDWQQDAVYTEDVRMIRHLKEKFAGDFFAGAVVNPFKYRADSQFGQFFKLVKKFNAGAEFAVAQAGWDMRKLQALKWYLGFRGLEYPLIARLILLTPDRLDKIRAGQAPGIGVSPDFEVILRRELNFSSKQFEAAQWRRLELQVAGCKLLGFSAVQISGIDTPDRLKLAALRLRSALREFATFEQWVEEYNSYQARAEMAPAPDSFMMFDRLLQQRYLAGDANFSRKVSSIGALSVGDRFRYESAEALLCNAFNRSASRRRLLKYLLVGCRGCDRCRLPMTGFVCTERCPKKLANGPCGGVRPDGVCETGGKNCIFLKQIALAEWRGELDRLEDCYVPAAGENQ